MEYIRKLKSFCTTKWKIWSVFKGMKRKKTSYLVADTINTVIRHEEPNWSQYTQGGQAHWMKAKLQPLWGMALT